MPSNSATATGKTFLSAFVQQLKQKKSYLSFIDLELPAKLGIPLKWFLAKQDLAVFTVVIKDTSVTSSFLLSKLK